MKFDILHAQAGQTVTGTDAAVDEVQANVTTVENHCDALQGALTHSPVVSSAVQALRVEVLQRSGDAVVSHARSATSAASQGLGLYQAGDQEMAQNSSSSESRTPRPDAPGAFGR